MLHNDNDRDFARNQFIALFLLSLLVLGWMYYFMPPPPSQPAAPPSDTTTAPAPAPAPTTLRPVEQDPYGLRRPAPLTAAANEDSDWLRLPPPVDDFDPDTDLVVLNDGQLELTFTRVGARLKQATVLLGREGIYDIQLVPTPRPGTEAEALLPLGLDFTNAEIGRTLNHRRWEVESLTEREVTFVLEVPGAARFRKTFALGDARRVVEVRVEYEHLDDTPRLFGIDFTPAYFLQWEPQVASMDEAKGVQQALVWFRDGEVESVTTANMTIGDDGRPFQREIASPGWVGVRSAYFVVAMRPEFEQSRAWSAGSPTRFFFGLGVPAFEARMGERVAHEFRVYVGPSQLADLSEAWPELTQALQFFNWPSWLDAFAKFLLGILHWMYGNIYANYGVAIILLTALVRIVVFPLSLPQMKTAKKMQLLGPEIERLKEEHKDDPAEMNKAMMALWQERGVNPLGGCLPLLLQFPVFIALYRMLWSAFELRGAEFLWIADLSEPDKLFTIPQLAVVPFIGEQIQHFNLLPILATATMVISMRFAPGAGANMNPQQKTMMTLMPIVFGLLFYSWASGLNLYVFVSTLIGIGQSLLVRRIDFKVDIAPKTKPAARKKQNFYAAAKAKRREIEKEMKQQRGAQKRKRNGGGPAKKSK